MAKKRHLEAVTWVASGRIETGARLIERLDHVAVVVGDANKAARFYRDVLSLPFVYEERLDHLGVRLVYLDMGSALLQLVEPVGPGRVQDYFERNGEGLHHLCLAVRDLPTMLAALVDEEDTEIFQGGRDRVACFLQTTPNRVLIELTEVAPRLLADLDDVGSIGPADSP